MKLENFDLFIERKQFHHAYQPVFSLNSQSEMVGSEFLLRSKISTPDVIFEQAKKANRLYELDTSSIYNALHTYTSIGDSLKGFLFFNIFPSTLVDSKFPTFLNKILKEFPESCSKIVFELNETEKADSTLFSERVRLLKESGFLVAIDDVGKGWSSLTRIIELDPHFIKLDLYFSQSLSVSRKKQLMIQTIAKYCESCGIRIILEGIETEEDLLTAKALQVHYGQGYLLCRPQTLCV